MSWRPFRRADEIVRDEIWRADESMRALASGGSVTEGVV
jgi:hypothetical protein